MSASNDLQTQTGSQLKSWATHRMWKVVSFHLLSVHSFPLSVDRDLQKKGAYENDKYTNTKYWVLVSTYTCKICGDTTTVIPVIFVFV